jgi:hypothetical protein
MVCLLQTGKYKRRVGENTNEYNQRFFFLLGLIFTQHRQISLFSHAHIYWHILNVKYFCRTLRCSSSSKFNGTCILMLTQA